MNRIGKLSGIIALSGLFLSAVPASAKSMFDGAVGVQTAGQCVTDSESKSKFSFVVGSGWGFGVAAALDTPAGMDVKMGRSFNFCIEDLVGLRYDVCETGTLNLGMGIDLRNYKMTGNRFFYEDPATKQVSVEQFGAGFIPTSSKLHALYTTYNLKYIQKIGKDFKVAFGPELMVARSVNRRRYISTKYTFEGNDMKDKQKDIRFNKVGINLVAAATYKGWLGVYCKYSPSNVLDSNFGPEFQSLSVGVMIGGL